MGKMISEDYDWWADSGQACTAPSEQTQIAGAKDNVQQGCLHRSSEKRMQKSKPHRTSRNMSFSVWRPARAGKTNRGDYENGTEWHRVYAWSNLSSFAKTLQNGQLISLEGKIKYREVSEEVEALPSSTASPRSA
jgi:single-strand DNA-binding protein